MTSLSMKTARRKAHRVPGRSPAKRNGKKESFRALKAFGLWRNRADLTDPVQFTSDLRTRMDRPSNAR
jgi:hypothetical protein